MNELESEKEEGLLNMESNYKDILLSIKIEKVLIIKKIPVANGFTHIEEIRIGDFHIDKITENTAKNILTSIGLYKEKVEDKS